ncbi:MAG TPA: prenyltransferase/squalene oxidase repeat-containing protein [Solirubrobacteraceae bacterium]|nr:prenyltransferase/squalene oxidase repeat-containing protein [Solirubrobacteraceae bacterium]
MTWQVGAFAILALALAGGFAWYERIHPDARIVALVGTLAAFAALGRIAFVALPNIKPTTDIVLVSGYALGGGPGFAVGALAGLTSNFFFGQGPWTPWQMAGWGLTGVIGAGLAVVTGRRIGRWSLAIVCTVVGFGYTMLQDAGDWVTYSDHSLAQLGVYVGKGIGFDAVHAAGCLVFALALGPAMIHSLGRFANRLQVRWAPTPTPAPAPTQLILILILSLIFTGGGAGLVAGQVGDARAASTPAGYLLAAQNDDGGFGASPGAGSSQLYAGWAALGLAAAGNNPQDVAHGGHTLIDYIGGGLGSATDPGSVERTILVLHAAGISAYSFGGQNLVSALERHIRQNGSVANQVNWTAFAVLALRAAGTNPPAATIAWLIRQQDADGGFNFAARGGQSDPDDTGAALEALAGTAGSAAAHARSRAVRFLRGQQDGDGGFASLPGAGSNAQSTAFAVQGLLAAGVNPGSVRRRGTSPLDYLRSLIAADGHVRYARDTDQTPVWVTAEALMALDGKALPLPAVPRPTRAPLQRPATPAVPARPAPATPTAATPATAAHRRAPTHATPRRASRTSAAPPIDLDSLAGYTGVLTELSLATVGAG